MYKVRIEQTYNTVEFEFQTANEAVEFIEGAVKNCKQTTTFKLQYTNRVVVEEEGGEEA